MMYSGCSYPSPFQLHQSVSIWMSARLKQHVVVELWLYRAVLGSLVVAAGTGMSSARCLKDALGSSPWDGFLQGAGCHLTLVCHAEILGQRFEISGLLQFERYPPRKHEKVWEV